MKLQLTIAVLVALATNALSQRIYTLAVRENHNTEHNLFTATETKYWPVLALFPNFHKVEGSSYGWYYDAYDWSLPFKNLADNSWTFSHTNNVYAEKDQVVKAHHYYYTIDQYHPQYSGNGYEAAYGNLGLSIRYLREKVTDHVDSYAVTP